MAKFHIFVTQPYSLPAKNITTKKVKKNKILGNKDGETKKWEEESKERKERTVFVGNVALSVKKKVQYRNSHFPNDFALKFP